MGKADKEEAQAESDAINESNTMMGPCHLDGHKMSYGNTKAVCKECDYWEPIEPVCSCKPLSVVYFEPSLKPHWCAIHGHNQDGVTKVAPSFWCVACDGVLVPYKHAMCPHCVSKLEESYAQAKVTQAKAVQVEQSSWIHEANQSYQHTKQPTVVLNADYTAKEHEIAWNKAVKSLQGGPTMSPCPPSSTAAYSGFAHLNPETPKSWPQVRTFGKLSFAEIDDYDDVWRWAIVADYKEAQHFGEVLLTFHQVPDEDAVCLILCALNAARNS